MRLLPLLLLVSCGSDIGITKDARCDGALQGSEKKVDDAFDADGDGFFDASNPDCAEIYPADRLDCDDGDATVNPEAAEVVCDGVDNDCSVETLDSEDADADGYDACTDCDDGEATVNPGAAEVCNDLDDDCDGTADEGLSVTEWYADDDADGYGDPDDPVSACEQPSGTVADDNDCDDNDATVNPGLDEVCDDDIDNDCNGQVDENCSYTGTWALDQTIVYSCAIGSVNINFAEVFIQDNNPTISVSSTGTGSQPGTMQGTLGGDVDFTTKRVLTGTCNELYEFNGSFLDDTHFTATFTATFTGSFCLDCSVQSWSVSGSR